EAPLGADRPKPGLEVAGQDSRRSDRAELRQGIDGLERVVEELAVIVDPAHPRPGEELVAEDLAPEAVDLVALGEEAVAADVQAGLPILAECVVQTPDFGRGACPRPGDVGRRACRVMASPARTVKPARVARCRAWCAKHTNQFTKDGGFHTLPN